MLMKSHISHVTTSISTLTFVFVGSLVVAFPIQASDITPQEVVTLVNEERAKVSVPALVVNEKLTQAAEAKAEDMAREEYFAHTSPKGLTPWYWIEKSGYMYRYAGENLAIRFTDAKEQNKAWMDSPKHRENIVSVKYQETGVAVRTITLQDGAPSVLTVEMFGTRSGQVLASSTQATTQTIPEKPISNQPVEEVQKAQSVPAVSKASTHTAMSANISLFIEIVSFMVVMALIVWGSVSLSRGARVLVIRVGEQKSAV